MGCSNSLTKEREGRKTKQINDKLDTNSSNNQISSNQINHNFKSNNTNKFPQSKNILNDIKSKYILNQIFNNLQKNRLLDIIRYNNKLKKQLNLNIQDYKAYSQIELEIIPLIHSKCQFINILNKDKKKYYHIYFNNNKEEINRCYLTEKEYQ